MMEEVDWKKWLLDTKGIYIYGYVPKRGRLDTVIARKIGIQY